MAEREVLDTTYEALHYEVTLHVNVDEPENGQLKFQGDVKITIQTREQGLEALSLNVKDLEVKSCSYKAEGAEEPVQSSAIEVDAERERVACRFNPGVLAEKGVMSLEFEGVHSTLLTGFYQTSYRDEYGKARTILCTQLAPASARRVFPCVDEPGRKATFQCNVIAKERYTVLNNMPAQSCELLGNGRKKVVFERTPKMSTYLVAFIVGDFDYVEATAKNGTLVRAFTPIGRQSLGDFALDVTLKALEVFEEVLEQEFALPKLDLVPVKDFAAGAMENWGLIIFKDRDLLFDLEKNDPYFKTRVAHVTVHELAHQWFGNLVTFDWWNDLWLSEGFASFMEAYVLHRLFPDWNELTRRVVDVQKLALNQDCLRVGHPIEAPVMRVAEAEEIFDDITYRKGSSIVRQMHTFLGDEAFVNGLRAYLDRNKFQSAVTSDLWEAFESVVDLPVGEIMSGWTEQQGFPLVTVHSATWDEANGTCQLDLEQERFYSDGATLTEEQLWQIPIVFSTVDGVQVHPQFLTQKRQTITIQAKKGWLKLNASQGCLYRVNYTSEMWQSLMNAARSASLKDEGDLAGLVSDATALCRAQRLNPVTLLRLMQSMKNIESYPVWQTIGDTLEALTFALSPFTAEATWFGWYAADLLGPMLDIVMMTPAEEFRHNDILSLFYKEMKRLQNTYYLPAKTVEMSHAKRNSRWTSFQSNFYNMYLSYKNNRMLLRGLLMYSSQGFSTPEELLLLEQFLRAACAGKEFLNLSIERALEHTRAAMKLREHLATSQGFKDFVEPYGTDRRPEDLAFNAPGMLEALFGEQGGRPAPRQRQRQTVQYPGRQQPEQRQQQGQQGAQPRQPQLPGVIIFQPNATSQVRNAFRTQGPLRPRRSSRNERGNNNQGPGNGQQNGGRQDN